MNEAGRKLTIRMPDNPRLRTATVAELHLEPGARVRAGTPVMSLTSRRRQHMVRAPRPGLIVPLVAVDDVINGGDPLYILNLDEAALAEANRDARALVVAEREERALVAADPIDPIERRRKKPARDLNDFAEEWGKPILAIALYVLACFALLPIINAVSREASTWGLVALGVASIAFAAAIFHLYAPNSGVWPRFTVRLVSLSWVVISALAILHRPDDPSDVSLADAGAPLLRLFAGEEERPPDAPALADRPQIVERSGVLVGWAGETPVPTYTLPVSVLAGAHPALIAHGVSVRGWGRVNPDTQGGQVMIFALTDAVPAAGDLPVRVLVAEPAALGAVDKALPEVLLLSTLERDRPREEAAPVLAVLLGEGGIVPAPLDALPLMTGPASGDGVHAALPASLGAGDLPDAPRPATSHDQTPDWLSQTPIPVIATSDARAPEALDLAVVGIGPSSAPERARRPSVLEDPDSPDLVLIGLLKSGEDRWMTDQSDLLLARAETTPRTVAAPEDAKRPVPSDAPADARSAPDLPGEKLIVPLSTGFAAGAAIALLQGNPDIGPDLRDTAFAGAGTVGAAPDHTAPGPAGLVLAAAPSDRPITPVPEPEPAAAPDEAERVLLYLYYDDPRLDTQPGLGDEWAALVSPELDAAIRGSTVEAVHEIVQVARWCPSAGGGDAPPTAALSDRIRLLQVRVRIDPDGVALLEQELPIFGGTEPGFFHNKRPLIGGVPGEAVMDRARRYLRAISNRAADLNTPELAEGGLYFDDPDTLVQALRLGGCRAVEFNDGAGPTNRIGEIVSDRLGG